MSDSENILLPPWEGPAILLVDLDAFFASVEQLDHPAWRGKPVIVGGDADARGVVSTCSYEARAFGVRSAMASALARQLCPEAIWTRGHFHRYREVSAAIMAILRDETPHVQQVSIDEAFMDVSPTAVNTEHPVAIARRIQDRVAALGVTCSIGVGVSKSVAKIASDRDKPRGLTVVYPGTEQAFLAPLPVRTMSGVGAAAEKVLKAHGIRTLGDMAAADAALLKRVFGKNGEMMRERALGADRSPVVVDDEVKSVSNEVTFAEDLTDRESIEAALATIAAKVGRRLRRKGLTGRTIAIKVRYDDRSVHSVQRQLTAPTDDDLAFAPVLRSMIDDLWEPGMKIRLLGVAVTHFETEDNGQESLFDASLFDEHKAEEAAPLIEDDAKRRRLIENLDALRDRFGDDTVRFGFELRNQGNTTGSSSKNVEDYK